MPNKFRENWGSALQYLEGSTEINKKHFGEESIYNNIEDIVNKKLQKHIDKVNLINLNMQLKQKKSYKINQRPKTSNINRNKMM